MEKCEYRLTGSDVEITIRASNSYLIKKYRERLLGTKSSELMRASGILKNGNRILKLRQHLTFKDLREEQRNLKRKEGKKNR